MYATTHNGLTLYRFDNLSRQAGIDTFVTPRSTATGSDFNLGLYAGGDTLVIEANLTRLCEALELSRSHLIFPEQTHGNAVAVVDPYQKDCPSEFKDFSGAGLAFKLIYALETDLGDPEDLLSEYSDLSACL